MYRHVIIGAGPAARRLAETLAAETQASTLLLADGLCTDAPRFCTEPQRGLNLRTLSCAPPSTPLANLALPPLDPEDAEHWKEGLGTRLALEAGREREASGDASSEQEPHPLGRAFVRAGIEAGLPFAPRHSRKLELGVTLHSRAAPRPSTPMQPEPPQLTILTGVRVRHLQLKGDRVTGLVFEHEKRSYEAEANSVILCAGALRNPHLLFSSGIGPPEAVAPSGATEQTHGLSGVGRGLADMMYVPLKYHYPQEPSGLSGFVYDTLSWFNPSPQPGIEAYALVQSPLAGDGPDLLLLLSTERSKELPTYTIYVTLLHPRSRGFVAPGELPVVDPRYLEEEQDLQALLYGLKLARRLAETRSLGAHTGRLLEPRPSLTKAGEAGLRAYLREAALPGGRFTGTCRADIDAQAPVDSDLTVRGVRGLFIADASVLPHPPRGSFQQLETLLATGAAQQILSRMPAG